MGALYPADLKAILPLQGHMASLEDSVKAAAGVRKLLGHLLLKAKRITPRQLETALKEQRVSGDKLGEVLVKQGLLTANELNVVLAFQNNQSSDGSVSGHLRLGEILVTTGHITRQQLKEVIARQKHSDKKIGELLVEQGCLQPQQIEYGLQLQQKLVTAALVAALSMANMPMVQNAYAGSSSSSITLAVSAKVLEHTDIRIIKQVRELVITARDVTQGFVDIPLASLISVKTNNPRGYFLVFEVMNSQDDLFHSVSVVAGGKEFQLSPGSNWIHQPYIRGGITIDLDYRLSLSKNVHPGTYNWPIMVSALPM